MPEETKNNNSDNQRPIDASDVEFDEASGREFEKLLDKDNLKIPVVGDIVKGAVLSASKAEVKLDIGGITTGVVRGRELYFEAEEYANLKPGDEVEATVVEAENENGELELSFRSAGQQKAWNTLLDAWENRKIIKARVNDANKGGLLVSFGQIQGFLPVSQLAPENYPRVNGGDKSKILDKLRTFVGADFEVKIMTLDQKEEKLVVSEKEAWQEKQRDVISKYKVGSVVEGMITALTDFGVFVNFGENLEGLIHISELAWQRIDDPADLFKVGDKIKAEIISLEGSKIFLSAKKLLADPWQNVENRYKVGQVVSGTILKINPFGLFVKLDEDIHGLSHISQLGLRPEQKINEAYKVGEKKEFAVVSIEPKAHRLGLVAVAEEKETAVPAATLASSQPAGSMPAVAGEKPQTKIGTEKGLAEVAAAAPEAKADRAEKADKMEKAESKAVREKKLKAKKIKKVEKRKSASDGLSSEREDK
jgi:ribosomal protein S1